MDTNQFQNISSRTLLSLRHCVILIFLIVGMINAQESYRSTYRVEIEKPAQPAQRSGESSTWRFQVKDVSGSVRTEILREVPYDVAAPSPAVFENGTVALIHSLDNMVEFFGTDGGLVRRLALSPVPDPDYERIIRHAVHDGSLALLISEPTSTTCRLLLLDASGNTLRDRNLEGIQATGVVIAPDGKMIAAGVRTGLRALDEAIWWSDGENPPKHEVRSRGVMEVKMEGGFSVGEFSADGTTFLGRTNVSVIEVDVATAQKRWNYRVPQGQLVVDAVMAPSGTTMLTAETPTLENKEWIYRRPVMRTMAADGRVVSERAVPSLGFKKATLKPGERSTEVIFEDLSY